MPDAPVRVSWNDLQHAFEVASFGEPGEAEAVLCRESGAFLLHSDAMDFGDEWPDDVDDRAKYTPVPHRKQLGLGNPLVLAFAEEFLPGERDEVRQMFERSGAWRRFKGLLHRTRTLERWYAFEAAATEKALRAWCEANAIVIDVEE